MLTLLQPFNLDTTKDYTFANATLGNLATANYYTGNGSLLSGVVASSATTAGTVTTAAQPNITSTGTLSSLSVSGLITATGTGIKTANIQDSTGTITITTKYNDVAGDAGIYGSLTVGTSGSGNVTASYFIGDGSQLTGITSTTITDNTSANTTYYPVYATSNTGSFTTAGISTTKLQFNPSSGQLTVQDLNTLSDATLKTNHEVIADPFTILNQLFGMGFNWLDSGKKSYGLMAQMLENILPELVSENAQGKKTVNYIPIIAFLIEAVKKNQAEIEELKKR